MAVTLHPQLQNDCYLLGEVSSSTLLLHKNALIPWFILVPDTDKNELFKLSNEQQRSVTREINLIASFIEQHFKTDKINIATIGNVVPQLHVHIIGRYTDDFCWPNPVWGQTNSKLYDADEITSLKNILLEKHIISK